MQKSPGQAYLPVILVGIFILIAIASVIFLYGQNQKLKKMLAESSTTPTPASTKNPLPTVSEDATPPESVCTLETKICPDGSSVDRSGPNCEFAPCPQVPGITNLSSGQKITSPLIIKGLVPAGWMFEGVFPVKIFNSAGALIKMGQAKEDVPGSWQSGKNVNFTAEVIFEKPASGSGKIRLENDNPSGIPSNSRKFDLPVSF